MAGWWGDGEWGSVWEGCWVEKMVRTGVQHVRRGGREPKCGMSAYGVSGALGARGREVSGGFGIIRVAAEMDAREFGVSCRFVQLCQSWCCLIMVPVCRCVCVTDTISW